MTGARGGVALLLAGLLLFVAPGVAVVAQSPNVLTVGPAGYPGAQYTSIQAAVNAAHPGDWVLVAPGVYHEKGYSPTNNPGGKPAPAEVYITTPNIHLRGMNRDQVIVDGTNFSTTQAAGTSADLTTACSSAANVQDPGVHQSGGSNQTREGIVVWKVGGVSIENLTSCNSLDNEIWWNMGDGGGVELPMPLHGDYITGTSTYYKDGNSPSAQYGIFTSDVSGPSAGTGVVVSVIDHSYANNMTDSSYYVGACRNCYQVLERPHAENSALGLSTTNAGGNFIVENGEWDVNRTGLVSNAQNNDDWPSPELGQCVDTVPPPGAGPNSCYVIRGNRIHDNNNPNTPGTGLTAVSAVGTGVELAATQHISVINNTIYNQGAWGVVTHDFPDPETGPAGCQGGVFNSQSGVCLWFSRGNFVAGNHFSNDGFFANPTNGDIANQAVGNLNANGCPKGNDNNCVPSPGIDQNCFTGNTLSSPTAEWPLGLQEAPCQPGVSETPLLTAELVCGTGAASLFTQGTPVKPPKCQVPGLNYPQHNGDCTQGYLPGQHAVLTPPGDRVNGVCFLPLSYTLSPSVSPTMPDPCAGVPANAYCPANAPNTVVPLPNTATVSPLLLIALTGAVGAVGLIAATVRRRRADRLLVD